MGYDVGPSLHHILSPSNDTEEGSVGTLLGTRDLGTIGLFQSDPEASASTSKRGKGKKPAGAGAARTVFLEVLNDRYVVVAGSEAETKHPVALLIDTKYGALKGRINLYTSEAGSSKGGQDITSIACINNNCIAIGTQHSGESCVEVHEGVCVRKGRVYTGACAPSSLSCCLQ